jgi:ArsR family transcriptional regulator
MERRRTPADWRGYELHARVIQGLAHPIRVAIAELLRNGEVCVCEIADRIGAERSNVSRHLAVMLNAGIVRHRKEGLQVFYSLRTPCVLKMLDCAVNAAKENLDQQAKVLARL